MSYKLIAPNTQKLRKIFLENTQKLRIGVAYFDFLWYNYTCHSIMVKTINFCYMISDK